MKALPLLDGLDEGSPLLADRAYDTDAIRGFADQRGAWANIPPKSNRKTSFAFSKWLYRQRNLAERFFNKLKIYRGIPPSAVDINRSRKIIERGLGIKAGLLHQPIS